MVILPCLTIKLVKQTNYTFWGEPHSRASSHLVHLLHLWGQVTNFILFNPNDWISYHIIQFMDPRPVSDGCLPHTVSPPDIWLVGSALEFLVGSQMVRFVTFCQSVRCTVQANWPPFQFNIN